MTPNKTMSKPRTHQNINDQHTGVQCAQLTWKQPALTMTQIFFQNTRHNKFQNKSPV